MRKFATLGCSLFALVHVNASSCDSSNACSMEGDQSALLQSMKGLEAKAGKKEKEEELSPTGTKFHTYCTGTSGSGMSEEQARRECTSKGRECPAIYEPGNDPGKFFVCPSDTTYVESTSGSTVYPMNCESSSTRRRRRKGKGKGKGKKSKHYCKTMAKDFKCYRSGLPACCTDLIVGNCPELQPPCESASPSGARDSPEPSRYSPAPYPPSPQSYGGDDSYDYDSGDDDDYDSDSSSYGGNGESYVHDPPSRGGSGESYVPDPPSYGGNDYSYSPSPPSYGGRADPYASSYSPSPPSYGGGSDYR